MRTAGHFLPNSTLPPQFEMLVGSPNQPGLIRVQMEVHCSMRATSLTLEHRL